MGEVVKTVGRAAAGVFTLGLSEVVGGAMGKPTAGVQTPGVEGGKKVDEDKVMEDEKLAERRRRQMIARQNRNIQTSPLGASIDQGLLGGTTLTGQ